MSVAMSTREAGAPAPPPPPPASPPADTAGGNALRMRLPASKAVDQAAGQAPPMEEARATSEQDKRKPDARSDALRQQTEFAAAEAKQTAPVATTAGNAREIQLQTNTAAGVARPRGPVPSQQAIQQANQQAGNQPQYAQAETPVAAPAAPTTAGAAAPVPATAPAPAPVAAPVPPPARTEAAVTDARERRANEEPGGLTESVSTTTSTRAGARRTAPPSQAERGQAAGGDREGQARSKDEPTFKALGYVAAASAVSSFAEPGGRLQWRIADGRRLESSSDGGATWTGRYTAGDRLRAGIAPAIDSAWAVGERGLVLRLTVPGGWTPVSRPAAATLIAVSATGSQVARVTADDGRVFETVDGGATWTPATPGAGPR